MNPFYAPDFQSLQMSPMRAALEPTSLYRPRDTGYLGIYNKPREKASPAIAPVIEGLKSGEAGTTGGEGRGTGFSSTSYAPPGTGLDALGYLGGVAGLATGIPGLSTLGGLAGAYAANQTLSQLGLPANVGYGQSALAATLGPTAGLFGVQGSQQSFDAALSQAIANSALGMTPDETAAIISDRLAAMQGPSIAQQYGAMVASGQMSPGMAFSSAINDLNTVGQLGEVLGAISPAPTVSEAVPQSMSGTAAVAESLGGSPSAPEGFSGGTGEQDPGGGWARGGYVPGKSGGMDDDVPAIIDGKQPARLSSGEFVFDAATVAALGDGNNQAGARKLDGLRKAIRQKAYGHEKQPPKNYSVGDLVRIYDRRR